MQGSFPNASVVIATYNNAKVLRKVLSAMLRLDYPAEYEIIVVDDGSSDGTAEMLHREFGKEKAVKIIAFKRNQGVCRARNAGIKAARYPIVVNMDHDCIPEKRWLREIVKGFDSEKIGVVSSFGDYGGTSTAFRKELLDRVGGYDERYRYYREDTDLTFSIMDLGYKYRRLRKQFYFHDHREIKPKGAAQMLRYLFRRLSYHMNDALLFKKHGRLAAKFLDVRLGFLVNPRKDFAVVTGTWMKPYKLVFSSPRGMRLIENKSPLHATAIIMLGIAYVFAVKFNRLLGSIKFKTFLL